MPPISLDSHSSLRRWGEQAVAYFEDSPDLTVVTYSAAWVLHQVPRLVTVAPSQLPGALHSICQVTSKSFTHMHAQAPEG